MSIKEHEIPQGSKLYFGKSASLKREIESIASDVLNNRGYEEIVTPLFSYHQHQSISDDKALVRVNDIQNHNMTLRADSTIDVVRIIQKRLGRNTTHKQWFYIQSVYRYPSIESYQVGAEFIDESNLEVVLNDSIEIFKRLRFEPLLQISNINIPKKIVELVDLELEDFKHINIKKMLSLNIDWLTSLVYIQSIEDIDNMIDGVPETLKDELLKLKSLAQNVNYKKTTIAPLYYASMLYYDELYFKMIENNFTYARGGRYKNDDVSAVGFAIEVDELIQKLEEV